MRRLLVTTLVGLWATVAHAHLPLQATTPADKSTVAHAPSELVLDFKGNIRLTKVSVTHEKNPAVDLDLDDFKGFISDYTIPMLPLGAGMYKIEWRGLGDDGHALNGSFEFTIE